MCSILTDHLLNNLSHLFSETHDVSLTVDIRRHFTGRCLLAGLQAITCCNLNNYTHYRSQQLASQLMPFHMTYCITWYLCDSSVSCLVSYQPVNKFIWLRQREVLNTCIAQNRKWLFNMEQPATNPSYTVNFTWTASELLSATIIIINNNNTGIMFMVL